ETTFKADEIDFDAELRRYVAVGQCSVESGPSRLTAGKVTIQFLQNQTLDWARCEGDVYMERRQPETNSQIQGWGKTLDYYEAKKMAILLGEARALVTTPRLNKPATVAGARIEMDLTTQESRVLGAAGVPARVHLEPRPGANQQPASPVDLTAGQIVMNGKTHIYEATREPLLVRADSRLRAEKIVFEVEESGAELKTARAEEKVTFDGKQTDGSLIHATSDRAVYTYSSSELVLIGNVHTTITKPGQERPNVFQGRELHLNTKTGNSRLLGGSGTIPRPPTTAPRPPSGGTRPPTGDTNPGGGGNG
ncbi:MAG: hypothetical protein FJX77_05760, partial [Armatimonadetes bacterium]|nr:hypothetical protein [Armatimonadota bacterium]